LAHQFKKWEAKPPLAVKSIHATFSHFTEENSYHLTLAFERSFQLQLPYLICFLKSQPTFSMALGLKASAGKNKGLVL